MSTSKVYCPQCGSRKFNVIPGSECHCACGAAFRILVEPDTGIRLEIMAVDRTGPAVRRVQACPG